MLRHRPKHQQQDGDEGDGEICPGCGRASVRLLQCGWLVAVRACDRPDCLHPLLGPVRPVARSYTELSSTKASVIHAATGSTSDPEVVTALIATINSSSAKPDTILSAAASTEVEGAAVASIIINPDDVYVRCSCRLSTLANVELNSLVSATASLSLFSRSTGGQLDRYRASYKRCLRAVRASFRLSTPSSSCCTFRGLGLDSEMLGAVDKELAELDAILASDVSVLLGVGVVSERNLLYNCLRGLFRHCARSSISFKQMCTACFQQNIVQSRCTVLRLTNLADDFDLSQPLKRVLLRNCRLCGSPDQRVLVSWESAPPSALLVESPDGIPSLAVADKVGDQEFDARCSIRLLAVDGVTFAPTGLIERRRQRRGNGYGCSYVTWIYNADSEWRGILSSSGLVHKSSQGFERRSVGEGGHGGSRERWMAVSSETRFACFEDSPPPIGQPNSDILCVLYERLPPYSDTVSEVNSVASSLDQLLDDDENLPAAIVNNATESQAAAVADSLSEIRAASDIVERPMSLRNRLESVMRSRRFPAAAASAAASPRPPTLDSVNDSFVMSRFLDVVATTAAAAAVSSEVGASRRRHSRRQRLRGYAEDNRARFAAATSTAAASDVGDYANFDFSNLFL